MTRPHVYLAKDSADLICHCKCQNALITFPPQMDCPWCGCGWLFSCIECRKAFSFSRGVQVTESWEDLALRDLTNRGVRKPSKETISDWVAIMKDLLANVAVDGRYICLDGAIIPVEAAGVSFDGWHSHHDLNYVPQVAALDDPSIMPRILSNPEYWQASALETS